MIFVAILLGAAFIGYVILAGRAASARVLAVQLSRVEEGRKEEARAKAEALATWEYVEGKGTPTLKTWTLDFKTMRMTIDYRSPAGDHDSVHDVRRVGPTQWEQRLNDAYRREVLAAMETTLRRADVDPGVREDLERDRDGLRNADRPWLPMEERLVPSLETAYQRYTRTA